MKDLAYKIINQRDFPSFGWWIEQGATVTWENWNGRDSRNHPMFGGGIGWFYRDLAGLRVKDAGFRSFDIRPVVPEGLEWVDYTHNTTYGQIAIRWEHRDGRFTLVCDVPVVQRLQFGCPSRVWHLRLRKMPTSSARASVRATPCIRCVLVTMSSKLRCNE